MIRRPPGAMCYFVPSNKLVINSDDQARLCATCCQEHSAPANELPLSEFDTRIAMEAKFLHRLSAQNLLDYRNRGNNVVLRRWL